MLHFSLSAIVYMNTSTSTQNEQNEKNGRQGKAARVVAKRAVAIPENSCGFIVDSVC